MILTFQFDTEKDNEAAISSFIRSALRAFGDGQYQPEVKAAKPQPAAEPKAAKPKPQPAAKPREETADEIKTKIKTWISKATDPADPVERMTRVKAAREEFSPNTTLNALDDIDTLKAIAAKAGIQ